MQVVAAVTAAVVDDDVVVVPVLLKALGQEREGLGVLVVQEASVPGVVVASAEAWIEMASVVDVVVAVAVAAQISPP